jgi:NADPH:quinone reductase-like Zn-dependent oxidoreductase/acyl carrier protein
VDLAGRCSAIEGRDAFYAALEASGLEVPKERRVLREASFSVDEALAKLEASAPLAKNEPVPPSLLDAGLQLLARLAERAAGDSLARFELASVAYTALGAAPLASELWAHARLVSPAGATGGELAGELALLDARGECALRLADVRFARVPRPVKAEAGPFLYELAWRPAAEGGAAEPLRAVRDGVPCVARLVPLALPASGARREPAGGREFGAEAAEPERLAGATLREMTPPAPAPGEVAIAVRAAGISFLDVLRSFGLESSAAARGLGCEVAGVVRAVGRGVTGLRVGDEVTGFARGALATSVTTATALLARKPASLSFEQAAALPLARAVAWHALCDLARLRAGERLLVHSAGGGIGHAAVALARSLGAEVVATAGSAEKRASLLAHGAARATDSRAPRAAAEALAGGRPFDVALDLAGDGAALAVLAPGGRCVAMSRTGGAQPLVVRPNLSLHALDPVGLLEANPERLAAALRESLASDGVGPLVPLTVFPIAQLGRAIRFMAQSRHCGKVVVSFARRGEARIAPLGARERIAAGAVLAIGEIERFPAVARWLAAQHPSESLCVREGESLDAALGKLSAPLRAVVLAAGAEDTSAALARARAAVELASEQGAALTWLLSDAGELCAPGGASPGARLASALADLARARRARGEPVTALALALGKEVTPGALAQLTRVADSGVAAAIVHTAAPAAWDPASSPLVAELGAEHATPASKLASATPEERRARLRELVGSALAVVLRLNSAERARLDWHRPLAELGLDSLMGVELHARIEEAAGLAIPPAVLFAEPNLEAVVERLSASLGAQ